MTVGNLKAYLENFDDEAEIYYFDSEAGEDVPIISSWLSIKDVNREPEVMKNGNGN